MISPFNVSVTKIFFLQVLTEISEILIENDFPHKAYQYMIYFCSDD